MVQGWADRRCSHSMLALMLVVRILECYSCQARDSCKLMLW